MTSGRWGRSAEGLPAGADRSLQERLRRRAGGRAGFRLDGLGQPGGHDGQRRRRRVADHQDGRVRRPIVGGGESARVSQRQPPEGRLASADRAGVRVPGRKQRPLQPRHHPPVNANLVALVELVLDDRALALEVGLVDAGQRVHESIAGDFEQARQRAGRRDLVELGRVQAGTGVVVGSEPEQAVRASSPTAIAGVIDGARRGALTLRGRAIRADPLPSTVTTATIPGSRPLRRPGAARSAAPPAGPELAGPCAARRPESTSCHRRQLRGRLQRPPGVGLTMQPETGRAPPDGRADAAQGSA